MHAHVHTQTRINIVVGMLCRVQVAALTRLVLSHLILSQLMGKLSWAKILFHRIFHRYRGWLWAEVERFQGDDTQLLLQVIAAVNTRVKTLPSVLRRKKPQGFFFYQPKVKKWKSEHVVGVHHSSCWQVLQTRLISFTCQFPLGHLSRLQSLIFRNYSALYTSW